MPELHISQQETNENFIPLNEMAEEMQGTESSILSFYVKEEKHIQGDNFGLLHGWVDFHLGVPPWCPASTSFARVPPFQAESETTKTKSTQTSNKPKLSPAHPVVYLFYLQYISNFMLYGISGCMR